MVCVLVQYVTSYLSVQSYGVPGEELAQMLRVLGLRKKRLVNLLPLLEFITWSLLKEDSKVSLKCNWQSQTCMDIHMCTHKVSHI